MKDLKKIKSALISVYHKDKLDQIVKKLDELGVTIYSTGGTQSFIEELGTPVIAVEELTSYPSILGGRVKTLHPKVFGGILNRRDNLGDQQQIAKYEIPEIQDLILARTSNHTYFHQYLYVFHIYIQILSFSEISARVENI